MKELKGWDQYVAEAASTTNLQVRLPLFDGEEYIIDYPDRRRANALATAQANGDVDGIVLALLGDEAGARVIELSQDKPATVLDALVVDVLRKFGFIEEESEDTTVTDLPTNLATKKPANAKATRGKSSTATRSRTTNSRAKASSRS
jgi:hypothetical protein